ncbi:MAG: type II toxin-antitoxin system RelE/ParE family toxin [Methanosarcinales archaeon]|nr:type II toxin-antitoxin system RelE/ParE family toxin [Methanosarcinales archaeon]
MYRARFLKTFLKQEKKLDADIKERVVEAVDEILNNPYSGLNLKGDLRGYWNKRIGKYRIIYKIEESEKRVVFFDVDLRKRVYDRLKRR